MNLLGLQEARNQVDQVRDAAVRNQAVAVAVVLAFLVGQRDRLLLQDAGLQVDDVTADGVEDGLAGTSVPLEGGVLGEKVNACVILDDLENLVASAVRHNRFVAS